MMKYLILLPVFFYMGIVFAMDGPDPDKKEMFFLWKQVMGVEIKVRYLFKERSKLQDSDLTLYDRETLITNYLRMQK